MKRMVMTGAACMLALVLVIGCDEDDSGTNNIGTRDPIDSTFVTEWFEDDLTDFGFASIDISQELIQHIPGNPVGKEQLGAVALDDPETEVTINLVGDYSYSNGWHIFDFEATLVDHDSDDTVDIDGVDSVQVLTSGTPVQSPDETTPIDGLKARAVVDFDVRNDDGQGSIHHRIDLDVDTDGGADTTLIINGSTNDALSGSETTSLGECDASVTEAATITNLRIDADAEDGDCPEAGTIVVVATVDVQCVGSGDPPETLDIDGTWTTTAVVNGNNTVTITWTNGIVSWTHTEDCD